jgi:hypothetical protein
MEEPLRIIQGVLFNFFNNDYAQISKYTTFPNDLKDPLRVRIPGINEPKSDAEAPAILMSLLSKDDPKVKEVEAAKNAFLTVARHQSKLADMDDAYKAFKEEMKPFMTALGWEEYFDGFNDAGNDRFNTKEEFLNTFRAKAASLVPTLDRETGCVLSFAPDYVWISKETVAAPPSQPEEGLYNLEEGCSYLRFRYIDGKMLVCGLGMYKDTFSDIIDTPEFWEALRKEWARRQSQPK